MMLTPALSFAVIITALFNMQVVNHHAYRRLSEHNRIRVIPLEAPRGKIYDRFGRLLVTNRIAFDVSVIYQEMKDMGKVIDVLSGILDGDPKRLSEKIGAAKRSPFIPVRIADDITKDRAIRIEERTPELQGVIVTTRPLRKYNRLATLSHVTGHLGRITEGELEKYKTYGYGVKDFVGKDGIERSYDEYLKGRDGGLQVEIDSRGRQRRVLAVKKPLPGKDLHLSIDIDLQEFCDSLMDGKEGVILAMEPRTGEIFAFVSRANYDPNFFVSPRNFVDVKSILTDNETFPLLNRAISAMYPTGSIFKIVVAVCALDGTDFDGTRSLMCSGELRVGDRVFHCWKERGHGPQVLSEAIKNSCNVFFYQLGLFIGPDVISKYAFKFGLGRPTGIDLPGEANGLVPTVAWKRRKYRESWYRGETANYAIGQGYLLATPIQVLRSISTLANRGELVTPHVVSKIEDIAVHHAKSEFAGFSEEALAITRRALEDAVNAPHGTGVYARSDDIIIAGKTGTAQNPHGESHAWFTGFAPAGNPKITVVVFIEQGGKGGLEPAKFAKKIIEEAKRLELLL